ncbi:RRXRR domain-containing protein, partial [Phormidium sp. CCY1219]|uniref:RRXRR domain-containing protein n=1 Tax=Phormidium sp. CCY1219 TaxID=2886104 RepID=UPI002D1F1364
MYRRFPFTIVLKKAVEETPHPCRVKIDPGSKVTGLAILKDLQVLWAAELTHRGQAIKDALLSRRQLRR